MISPSQHRIRFAALLLATLSFVTGVRAEVLTSFGPAANSDQPPEGWRFAWNPTAPLEQVAEYRDLAVVVNKAATGRRTIQRGVLDDKGVLQTDAPTLSSNGAITIPRATDGAKRYVIASYTMPRDSAGSVWINDGNLQNKNVPTGTELKIFLNGVLRKELAAPMNQVPTLFQQTLGTLKKGDTVSVAVGPSQSGQRGGGVLRYTLEEWLDGKTPPAPRNTLWQPIDALAPQFDLSGSSAAYEAKQAALNKNLLARRPELVFIGDSITARWPQELLEKHFGAYRPVNLGVGGDWVQNVAWRLQRTSLEEVPVKAVVLLIGTNNISSGFTPEEITDGIRKLVETLKQKAPNAKILLLGVLPRGASLQDKSNEKVHPLNAKLQTLADGNKVFYLDVGPALAEPDGSISLEVTPDRLHVSLQGYLRWMDAMKPTLERLLPDRP